MIWVFLIIGLLLYFFLIKPFLRKREQENFVSYLSVPDEIKILIEEENVIELAEILVGLELEKEYEICRLILQAIDSKGFSFSNRVDKIRNEMRIQVVLGPLRKY